MGANKLLVHPAFYRRVRHYRNRIGITDGRPKVAIKFVEARKFAGYRHDDHHKDEHEKTADAGGKCRVDAF